MIPIIPMLPERGLLKVNYAANRGVIVVGLKNTDYAVLFGYFSSLYGRVLTLESHLGMSVGGETMDVVEICRYMRPGFSRVPIPIPGFWGDAVVPRSADHRPFRVGMLFASYDERGSHIYEVLPFGDVIDRKAMALGHNSQSALDYFERHKESFDACTMDQLICHGIRGLRESLGSQEYSRARIEGGVVGVDMPFKVFNPDEKLNYNNMADAMAPL